LQGTQRYLIFAHLLVGFLVWITLDRLFGAITYAADLPNPALIGSSFTLTSLLSLALAAAAGVYAFRHPKAHAFSTDVVTELLKVTWPSRKETQSSTVVVIVTTLILSGILYLFDTVWAQLTGLIYL
jgi:preprotein translocase subunit SecE